MAAQSGALALSLLCVLLSRFLWRAEGNPQGPSCEEHQRYRQNHAQPGVVWGQTMAVLGTLSAIMMLGRYAIHFISKDQGPQERKECELQWEVCQESGKKTGKDKSAICGSQALACSSARCESCPSVSSQTQLVYARQLACMEQQLEGLLCEVRSQRSTLKDILVEKECPPNMEKGSDKLRITVYEIADCEAPEMQPRGRRRQFK